jgi:hypothetical protein
MQRVHVAGFGRKIYSTADAFVEILSHDFKAATPGELAKIPKLHFRT